VTHRSLPARLAALEARCLPADGPTIIEIVFLGSKDGRPDGRRTDWDAHVPAVVVNGVRHEVGADETAHQAVQRIAASLPGAVVAYAPWDDPS
jgi:hypothetical protein